jgi:hypothetical protein
MQSHVTRSHVISESSPERGLEMLTRLLWLTCCLVRGDSTEFQFRFFPHPNNRNVALHPNQAPTTTHTQNPEAPSHLPTRTPFPARCACLLRFRSSTSTSVPPALRVRRQLAVVGSMSIRAVLPLCWLPSRTRLQHRRRCNRLASGGGQRTSHHSTQQAQCARCRTPSA